MPARAWQMELEKGGFCMRTLKKAAVTMSAVGLLAFGAVASGGSARAEQVPELHIVTGCESEVATVVNGSQPNCTALPGTVGHPSSITVYVDTDGLAALLNAQPDQGITATWGLACVVDGKTAVSTGSYTITSIAQPTFQTIDLQSAVGSPTPTKCTVELAVATALPITPSVAHAGVAHKEGSIIAPFTIGVVATADRALPGAVYHNEGKTSSGANAVLCANDTANGNAGSKIMAYKCVSDLAEYFVQTSASQLVHNGDCVSLWGNKVLLAPCDVDNPFQRWTQTRVGGWLRNRGTGTCLTASSARDGTQLTVASCGSVAGQEWHIPPTASIAPALKKGDLPALFAAVRSHRK
jgi:Ricin-type beta-trefoil lectin domain